MASSPATTAPAEISGSWLSRARALGPMIDAAAAADEEAQEITAEVVQAIDEAGLYSIMIPREAGGGEAHPVEQIDAIAELSYWDGSTGWYAHAVMTGGGVAGAFLGDSAIAAICPEGRYTHCAGQVAPTGKATREGDHYRVSGCYSFATGSPRAQWLVGGYLLHEAGEQVLDANDQQVMLWAAVPRAKVNFLGNWDVLGLRGTGSVDFEVPEQLIHQDFTFNIGDPQQRRGGPLYRMGFMTFSCISHGAYALGAARRMLEEWRKYASGKSRAPGLMMNDMQTFQRDFAQAHADLKAADAYMKQAYSNLYDAAVAGSVTKELQLEAKLSASHAYGAAMRIANAAQAAAATTGLRDGSALQRFFRDITSGNAHVLTGEMSWIEVGRVLGEVEGAEIYF
ncbi:MAG: acyl-CoA dehydrogenase family protein [Novosphingobium sp.]|nr:acyl-CoA dehydrogenase family protein [Novosphingobium sp.]